MAKIPLLLLSGLLSNQSLWAHQIKYLEDIASIQVISSEENTPEKMVGAILEKAPPLFALAGHSMGGWLSLEIMRVVPSRVTKLCLLNTTARSDSEEKRKKRKEMISDAQKGRFESCVVEIADKLVFNPLVKRGVEKMFREVGKEVFIHQEQAMLQRRETQSVLQAIRCPTLVIHASHDANFSSEEHLELAQIPDAKLAIVEDSGHMSPIEMPQAVTALLRFWLTYF